MKPLRNDTRGSALWGKSAGRRAKAGLLCIAVCAGLSLAASPVAGAAPTKNPNHRLASWN